MTDSLTWDKVDTLHRVQAMADDVMLGDDRYTELTLWDDGDFRIIIHHGFQGTKKNPDAHHGERIVFKESNGDVIYRIVLRHRKRENRVLQKKKIAELV